VKRTRPPRNARRSRTAAGAPSAAPAPPASDAAERLPAYLARPGARPLVGYLAAEGLEAPLARELGDAVVAAHGRLVLARADDAGPRPSVWAQNVWLEPRLLTVTSIGDTATQLAALTRNWFPYAPTLARRTELVRAALPHVGAKPLAFGAPAKTPLGSFTLLSPELVLASPRCSSPFPNGEPTFLEPPLDAPPGERPPSRAFLKLWEIFTLLGRRPEPGERCLDLGASPGGWTWVLARLGAEVVAYDRAPLAPEVAALPGVTARRGDAFAARPDVVGPVDWLFSDVICYPDKLADFLDAWRAAGACKRIVVSVKFQGEQHYDVIERLARVPGSRFVHLHANKHELTWALVPDAAPWPAGLGRVTPP
jgi:23S rRNA (cytidine2498-2'-O)-methyltransferase